MKVRYIGETIGVFNLTSNKVYEVLGYEPDLGMLRILDDDPNDNEGYLYDCVEPGDISGTITGRWEIVEDDENETLRKAIEREIALSEKNN